MQWYEEFTLLYVLIRTIILINSELRVTSEWTEQARTSMDRYHFPYNIHRWFT